MLPMRHPWRDVAFEIGEDLLEWLGSFRRRRRDLRGDLAWLHRRPHGQIAQARAIIHPPFGGLHRPRAPVFHALTYSGLHACVEEIQRLFPITFVNAVPAGADEV